MRFQDQALNMKKKKIGINDMKVNLDDLEKTSEDFEQAKKEMEMIVSKLSKSMKRLQDNWVDASHERFFQYYRDWDRHMGGVAEVLSTIAEELKAIGERYREADEK